MNYQAVPSLLSVHLFGEGAITGEYHKHGSSILSFIIEWWEPECVICYISISHFLITPKLISASIIHPCWFSVHAGFCQINDIWGMAALFPDEGKLFYIFSWCFIQDEADNMWLLYYDRKFFIRWLVKGTKTRRTLNTCETFADWQMTKRPLSTPVGINGFVICILSRSVKGLVRACQICKIHTLCVSMRVGCHCHTKDPAKHYHASPPLVVEYFPSVIGPC